MRKDLRSIYGQECLLVEEYVYNKIYPYIYNTYHRFFEKQKSLVQISIHTQLQCMSHTHLLLMLCVYSLHVVFPAEKKTSPIGLPWLVKQGGSNLPLLVIHAFFVLV